MNSWTIFSLAFAAVVLYSWGSRKNSPHWYLNCAVPLLYGGAIAWMFLGEDPLLALRVLIFGTALPALLLVMAWTGAREQSGRSRDESPAEEKKENPHVGSSAPLV